MNKDFDLANFNSYKENNRMEIKSAVGGLPESLWETYCAFANTEGGVIILGVKENGNGNWEPSGLKNTIKLEKNFWDLINNKKKISLNLLTSNDFKIHTINGNAIVVINVPMARRDQKPVYKGTDMFKGTYKRNGEGDYLCDKSQVLAMLRDEIENSVDTKVVDYLSLTDLNQDTIQGYRNMHQNMSNEHPFSRLNNEEYLRSIGAATVSSKDGKLHPTCAGLLMFGNDYDIVREFPEYFLDYQEHLDPTIRWTDRLWSTAGTWSGNIFDFFIKVYSKISTGLKIPFKMEGIRRIDDTPVHRAVREALVNCLSNADFYIPRGVVIKKTPFKIIFENPGYIRIGKRQMMQGGISDPRNKTILKMFNLLDIGERSGSGVPNIFNVWSDNKWSAPEIEEEIMPDRTRLILLLGDNLLLKSDKKQAEKTSEKNKRKNNVTNGISKKNSLEHDKNTAKKQAEKTSGKNKRKNDVTRGISKKNSLEHDKNTAKKQAEKTSGKLKQETKVSKKTSLYYVKIMKLLSKHGSKKIDDIANEISLSTQRTRALLKEMISEGLIQKEGESRARIYKIK